MKQEKHLEIINEVLDEIDSSLKDVRGLLYHQRRLAFLLSLGAQNILELFLHKHDLIKEGSKIDHRWFKKNNENIKEQLQKQVTSPLDSIENITKLIDITSKLEEKRDDLAYGAPATDKLLQEKINLFFDLKKLAKC